MRRRSVITTSTGTTKTDCVLDSSMFVRELRYNAGVAYNYATYLMGSRGPEYRRDDLHDSVVWYVYDGLGSVLAEVNPSGTVTASRKYDVYGSVRSSTGSNTSKHKFVGALGHPSDDESGLIYMQARYMDPQTGRFSSEDPKRHNCNWFLYCSCNPISRIDPNGRDDMAEDMEADEISMELQGENGLADFGGAKWYNSNGLVKAIQNLHGCSKAVAGAIIHAAKEYGLGGADNIGLDSAGGLWSKSGEFLGFVEDFL